MEIWKRITIEGYENFEVSNNGKIRNSRTNTILKPDVSNMGYERFNLYNTITKKQKKFSGHQLVALYFLDNPNNYTIVNHKDGNKRNNNVYNLEWCNHSHNNAHAYRTGLKKPEWD